MNESTFSSAPSDDNTLTIEKYYEMLDRFFPILYYGTDEHIEEGIVYICYETDMNPEYIVFHPNDIEKIKNLTKVRRLVHLKNEPKEKQLERLKNHLNKRIERNIEKEFIYKYSGEENWNTTTSTS